MRAVVAHCYDDHTGEDREKRQAYAAVCYPAGVGQHHDDTDAKRRCSYEAAIYLDSVYPVENRFSQQPCCRKHGYQKADPRRYFQHVLVEISSNAVHATPMLFNHHDDNYSTIITQI